MNPISSIRVRGLQSGFLPFLAFAHVLSMLVLLLTLTQQALNPLSPLLSPPIIRGLMVQKPPLILQLSLNFLVQAGILSLKQSFKELGGFL